MRFSKDGPSLPDDLLRARDEGRVVFFCGAGISMARTSLPNFFGLAESVIQRLGASADCVASRVLRRAREIGAETEISGLISADRIFALLERDFLPKDIQVAVAASLKPGLAVDRSAHELLMRLARTPAGKTQIVTTNFDRLLESETGAIPIYRPPRLPDLARYDELDGIVYLHGCVDSGYTRAEDDLFVISSSDFGFAYLAEGWATEFVREILQRFVVVFVGYSADDPPVHYLLEGLRRKSGSSEQIYAFQAEGSGELLARWDQKGVNVIPYSAANGHAALWESLSYWADRADAPVAWQRKVLNLAMDGPRNLAPHVRGQVAHVVSANDGARAFCNARPPAEWLCVFDPACRFAKPGRANWFDLGSQMLDPFDLYGLDSDQAPQSENERNSGAAKAEFPVDSWSVFSLNDADQLNLSPQNLVGAIGPASQVPRLPSRLGWLASWLGGVVDQPATMWWAARQIGLHPDFKVAIEFGLSNSAIKIHGELRKGWQYVLEIPESSTFWHRREWFELKASLEADGWSAAGVRRYLEVFAPSLQKARPRLGPPVPPRLTRKLRVQDLMHLGVDCPVPSNEVDIPAEWLVPVLRGLRRNLEVGTLLCQETGDFECNHISPIVCDPDPEVDRYQRHHGFSGCVIRFAGLFDRLVELDLPKAREEFAAWPTDDDTAFARLRVWASSKTTLATPHEFFNVIQSLTPDAFWDEYHQRDLLIAVSSRWEELSNRDRTTIERRLLKGPRRWRRERAAQFKERKAWSSLQRLQWLILQKCEVSPTARSDMESLRSDAPNWRPAHAVGAASSHEMRGGFVTVDTNPDQLLGVPLDSLLATAAELTGNGIPHKLRESDPLAGLSEKRPTRVYLALARAADRGEYPAWAWTKFLNSKARELDSSNLTAAIATRLCRMPKALPESLLYPATYWIQRVAKRLSKISPATFDNLIDRLVDDVYSIPEAAKSGVADSGRHFDWMLKSWNSPTGHLVLAILADSRIDDDLHSGIARAIAWIQRLLSIAGPPRCHAIAIAAQDLAWLHRLAPEWVEQHLLSILDQEDQADSDALLSGLLSNPQVSGREMFSRIKPVLTAAAMQRSGDLEGYAQSLAVLLVDGWLRIDSTIDERWLSNAEFRDILLHCKDEMRSYVLWQIQREPEDDKDRGKWLKEAAVFLREVWPRQSSVRTSKSTEQLTEFLVSSSDLFAATVDVVLPLLSKLTDGLALHGFYLQHIQGIVASSPERFLQLLTTVLPDDVRRWPYGVGDVISKIIEAKPELGSDQRFVSIRRRWETR